MIKLRVDDETAIPLSVDSSSAVSMTVSEAFIDRGGSAIQNNKNATPSTSQVEVTPDPGYDAMAKVTVEAVPQGALSPIDIDFDDSTGAFTAEARVGTSGYISDDAFVGGGFQLDTQAAATITPSTVQQQAVPAHKYTTGAVMVDPIPSEYIIPSGTKQITANGNAQDVAAYEKVNVNVPNTYAASDEGKVVHNGALTAQTSGTATENGTVDTTLINSLTVNVGGGSDPLGELLANTLTDYTNNTITSAKDFTFRQAGNLRDVRIPNVTYISTWLFANSSIRSLFAPNATLSGSGTSGCSKLEWIVSKAGSQGNAQLQNAKLLHTGDFTAKGSLGFPANCFSGCLALTTLILREATIYTLGNISAFNSSPFASGGAGGTIYIPKALYDHLGDGTSSDYKAATNWATINGYGTITWAKIEGSIYETQYADGTPIT